MSSVPGISTGICAKNKQRDKNNLLLISKLIPVKAGFRSLKDRETLGESLLSQSGCFSLETFVEIYFHGNQNKKAKR